MRQLLCVCVCVCVRVSSSSCRFYTCTCWCFWPSRCFKKFLCLCFFHDCSTDCVTCKYGCFPRDDGDRRQPQVLAHIMRWLWRPPVLQKNTAGPAEIPTSGFLAFLATMFVRICWNQAQTWPGGFGRNWVVSVTEMERTCHSRAGGTETGDSCEVASLLFSFLTFPLRCSGDACATKTC